MTVSAMRSPLRLPAVFCGAVVVVLQVTAMLDPSGLNWGFHHLAFLPPAVSVLILVLMASAFVPRIQDRFIGLAESIRNRPAPFRWIAGCGTLGVLFWVVRQQTFFLGDGYLVIRNLAHARSLADVTGPFPTAPLSGTLAYHIRQVIELFHEGSSSQLAWQIQSVLSGLVAVPLTFRLAGALTGDPALRWGSALFMVAGGALQLFCGYVETYPPAYAATILFVWLSLEYLHAKVPLVVPLLSFALLFTLHFGMLSLIPSVVLLLVVGFRRSSPVSLVLSILATVLFVFIILQVCEYPLEAFFAVLLRGGTYFLPLFGHDNWQAAYPLFSFWHVMDFVNAWMLLSPFLIILVPLAVAAALKREFRMKPATLFLGLAFLGAAGWTFFMNFEVGMSRDWDVIAPLSVCVVAFAVYGLGLVRDDRRGPAMAMMVLVTFLHTAGWVAVNAGEDSSITRYATLQDSRVRSRRALAYACEDLSGFYRDRKEYARAVPLLAKTVAIDSTNARRWLSLASLYQLAEQDEDAIHAYEESVRYGTHDKAAYFNLGILYYNDHRLDDAIVFLRKAAAIDPSDTLISSNLGLLLGKREVQVGHP